MVVPVVGCEYLGGLFHQRDVVVVTERRERFAVLALLPVVTWNGEHHDLRHFDCPRLEHLHQQAACHLHL